jgi:hypothetical protein
VGSTPTFGTSRHTILAHRRGVAQPGRAPRSGRGGRWFESIRPDQLECRTRPHSNVGSSAILDILNTLRRFGRRCRAGYMRSAHSEPAKTCVGGVMCATNALHHTRSSRAVSVMLRRGPASHRRDHTIIAPAASWRECASKSCSLVKDTQARIPPRPAFLNDEPSTA